MEYSKMPNIQTALPHFRDSFPSPSFVTPSSQKTYIAPLSASSLQQYNSSNNKRKAIHQDEDDEDDYYHEQDSNKRMMMMLSRHRGSFSSTRQRQESGCSVSSTSSSWSSSSSLSNISTASASKSPSLSSSPSLSPVEMDESSGLPEFNPLWHLCDAIALISEPTPSSTPAKKPTVAAKSPKSENNSPYGLKIVFVAPNWLAEHMAKAKKAAAMKRLHSLA
ncbi:hypothetical protein K457DRAFT_132558 [Linnemannia elongata AG-77]|uniref:Uncharacterized protein n=1 Tax=Linnemannia elongata AG-77 TaxID=1314771 RepID=A0A197KDY7_9FUNG|nr:hypothetical protein K457DRAFT_132558 [Linnemannia elongata AG-77]